MTIATVTVAAFPAFRARIVQNVNPAAPYDDGAAPILRVEYRNGWRAEQVTEGTSYVLDPSIVAAAERWGKDVDTFTRYVRAFHGVSRVDGYTSREGDTFLTLDPADWRADVGASVEAVTAQDDLMSEYRAYLEGDTYLVVVEKRETWRNVDTDDEREEWAEVASCGGFYGDADGYVTDRAREMIAETAGMGPDGSCSHPTWDGSGTCLGCGYNAGDYR